MATLNDKDINKQLELIASGLVDDIVNVDTNDEIYETLELLGEFVYRAINPAFEIVKYIIENKYPTKKYKSQFGEYSGKSHEDLVLKCVGILEMIRYHDKGIFMRLVDIQEKVKYKSVQDKIKEVLEKYAKYNYHAISNEKIGYGVQRIILDEILKWSSKDKKKRFDLIEIVSKEFLRSSFEGSSMKDYNTMVFQQGSLGVSDYLKKIRRDTIDMLVEMFESTRSEKMKLRILDVLNEATRRPMEGYDDKMIEMIKGDVEYLVKVYEKLAFNKKGKISSFPIVANIKEQLGWMKKMHGKKVSAISVLEKKIENDSDYQFFSAFVNDHSKFGPNGEDIENKDIENIFKDICDENTDEYYVKLNKIAGYLKRELIEDWKLLPFKKFLSELGSKKPEIAEELILKSFEKKSDLKSCAVHFLCGFREGKNLRQWDRIRCLVESEKDVESLKAIPWSISCIANEKASSLIRQKDINLLKNIINASGIYAFVVNIRNDWERYAFHANVMEALIIAYRKDKNKVEGLIVEELNNVSDNNNCLQPLLGKLDFATYRKIVNLLDFKKKNVKKIIKLVSEVDKLDHRIQNVMAILSEEHYEDVMNVFTERIKSRQESKGNRQYEAIPHQFNQELKEAILKGEKYEEFVLKWIDSTKSSDYIYCMDMGRLLRKIDGVQKKFILKVINKKSTKKEIENILKMFTFDMPNEDVLIGIIKMTENEDIWGNIGGVISQTGVVSGEHGISDSYKGKAISFERYLEDDNENVRGFAKKFVKEMSQRAKEERKREDEEIALRKIEFES
ncbi:hypothetical protein ACFL08_04140 [Patescibacteria group bacterium]